jgi:hypothetical protein
MAHIPYILACHLQIDADPDPDSVPAYRFDADADPNPDPTFQSDAYPDPQHWIMELLILKYICPNKIVPTTNKAERFHNLFRKKG